MSTAEAPGRLAEIGASAPPGCPCLEAIGPARSAKTNVEVPPLSRGSNGMAGMDFRIALMIAGGCAGALAASAPAGAGGGEPDPGALCSEAVALAERAETIPRHLLAAIAQAESGRPVAEDRVQGPWPWTVTARGIGMFFASKEQAMEAAVEALATGDDNVDVGCLQINLGHHPEAFMTLDEALDPLANAAYAAAYLRALFMQTGSWPEAVGRYHSATPARNTWYREKVLAFWNQGKAKAPSRAEAAGPEVVRRPAALAQEPPRPAGAPQLNKDALGELKTRLDALAPR